MSARSGKSEAHSAFGELMTMVGPGLYSAIRRVIRNQHLAEDVMQQVTLNIWLGLPSFRSESGFFTWAFRIARNEALNTIQKEKLRQTYSIDTAIIELLPSSPLSEHVRDAEEIWSILCAAIETLPEKQSMVFQLRYFDELTFKEISCLTGTSEGALKANYHHAVTKVTKYVLSKLNL